MRGVPIFGLDAAFFALLATAATYVFVRYGQTGPVQPIQLLPALTAGGLWRPEPPFI